MNLIDVSTCFRIANCIMNSLLEDLEYLSQIAVCEESLVGNVNLLALEREGLVIQAGIDANADVEEQSYFVSKLGRTVDRFALSANDEERQQWYKQHKMHEMMYSADLPTISEEEIDDLFD